MHFLTYIAVELCNKNPLSTQKGSKFATGKPHERSKTTPKMTKTRFYDTVFWSKTCTSTFTLCDHFFKNVCQLFFPKCKNIFHIVNFFYACQKYFLHSMTTFDDTRRWQLSIMHVNFWCHTSTYNFASMTTFCDAHFRSCMSEIFLHTWQLFVMRTFTQM